MDVGFYLGELLMQQGEVSVPGLGYFVQVRISGYYNDAERKFYPPYHQAQFDVQSIDDDALAEYIANKKNISVASARYFCEKYITNLKQQAAIEDVQIGNLGWFHTELSQLTFRPAEKIADDTIFFGFEPISIGKASDARPSTAERPKVELKFPTRTPDPVIPPPIPTTFEPEIVATPMAIYETGATPQVEEPEIAAQEPVETYQTTEPGISQEFFEPVEEEEEEEESRGPLRLILVILIAVVFIGLGVFALYRYQPDTFAKIAFWEKDAADTETVKPTEEITSKTDTALAGDTTQFIDAGPAKIDTIDALPSSAKKTEVITEQPVKTPATVAESPKTKPAVTASVVPAAKPAEKTTVVAATPAKTTTITTTPAKTPTVVSTAPAKNTAVTTAPAKQAATKPAVIETPKPTAAKTETAKTESTRIKLSDAAGTRRFEVYVSPACKDMAEANRLITKLKKNGLDARIVSDAAGPLIHVSIGHFKTAAEAKAFAVKAQETGKVTSDAYPNEIIPQ